MTQEGAFDSRGRREGTWQTRDASGRMRFVRSYAAGVPHGPCERFHRDGSVLERGGYEAGKRVGAFVAFYDDGSPWYRFELDDDRPVGIWQLWHPGGELSRRIDWNRAEDDGRTTVFGIDGAPGTKLAVFPAERRPAGALIVFDGVHWTALRENAKPVVLVDVPAPRLRPGTAWVTGGTELHDFGFPAADEIALIHQASFLGPLLLDDVDERRRMVAINRHALSMEYFAAAAGEELRLPQPIDVASRAFLLEQRLEHQTLEDAVDAMGARSIEKLVRGLRAHGAHRRADVLETARTGERAGVVDTILRRTRSSKYRSAPTPQWPTQPHAWVNDDFTS